MNRALAVVLAVALLVVGLLGYGLRSTRAELAEAKVEVQNMTAEVATQKSLVAAGTAAAKARAAEQARNDKTRQKEIHALTTALQRHPTWAAEPVPDDVAGALGVQYRSKD